MATKQALRFNGTYTRVNLNWPALSASESWEFGAKVKLINDSAIWLFSTDSGGSSGIYPMIALRPSSNEIEFRSGSDTSNRESFAFDISQPIDFYIAHTGGESTSDVYINGSKVVTTSFFNSARSIEKMGAIIRPNNTDLFSEFDLYSLYISSPSLTDSWDANNGDSENDILISESGNNNLTGNEFVWVTYEEETQEPPVKSIIFTLPDETLGMSNVGYTVMKMSDNSFVTSGTITSAGSSLDLNLEYFPSISTGDELVMYASDIAVTNEDSANVLWDKSTVVEV